MSEDNKTIESSDKENIPKCVETETRLGRRVTYYPVFLDGRDGEALSDVIQDS